MNLFEYRNLGNNKRKIFGKVWKLSQPLLSPRVDKMNVDGQKMRLNVEVKGQK